MEPTKYYSLSAAARGCGVSKQTISYAYRNRKTRIVRRKGGFKVFRIEMIFVQSTLFPSTFSQHFFRILFHLHESLTILTFLCVEQPINHPASLKGDRRKRDKRKRDGLLNWTTSSRSFSFFTELLCNPTWSFPKVTAVNYLGSVKYVVRPVHGTGKVHKYSRPLVTNREKNKKKRK